MGFLGTEWAGAHRRDQNDFLADGIEHGDDLGPDHHAVWQVQGIGIDARQGLGQPHHVIADRAKQARHHGR